MKNGLIFDLDGTLIDSLQGIAHSLNQALAEHSLPTHCESAVMKFIGNGARVLAQRALPEGASEEEIRKIEAAFKTHYASTWPSGTVAYPGITELLESLQATDFPLAVLSNKPHPFTTTIVETIFPHIHFKSILGQQPGIAHKPDPAGALKIAEILSRKPADCIFSGDSTVDLETARNAGMRAIAVTWGFHDTPRLLAAGASQLAHHPAELLGILLENTSHPLLA